METVLGVIFWLCVAWLVLMAILKVRSMFRRGSRTDV